MEKFDFSKIEDRNLPEGVKGGFVDEAQGERRMIQEKIETGEADHNKTMTEEVDKKQLEEITLARRAWEAGIPTPKVLGEIKDKGNQYAFFEKISAINLLTLSQLIPDEVYKYVRVRIDYVEKRFRE